MATTTPSPASSSSAPSKDDDDNDDDDDDDALLSDANARNAVMEDLVDRLERTGEVEYAFRAESMLRRTSSPDTRSYNAAISAWSVATAALAEGRAVLPTNDDGFRHAGGDVYMASDALRRAESLLTEMERNLEKGSNINNNNDEDGIEIEIETVARPDRQSYSLLMSAYVHADGKCNSSSSSSSTTATEAVEALLRKMERCGGDLSPNTEVCNRVMQLYSKACEDDCLKKAETFFADMKSKPETSPDALTYDTLIDILAKSADGTAEHSDRILRLLDEFEETLGTTTTTTRTYASVIRCLAKENSPPNRNTAAERAEKCFERLESRYETTRSSSLRPDVRTFNALLTAHARRPDPRKCEATLERMESSDHDVTPDVRSFTIAVDAWAKSRDVEKPQRALRLLKRASALAEKGYEETQPTTRLYNAVIECCFKYPKVANAPPERESAALRIAFAVFQKSRGDSNVNGRPDQGTYARLFKCVDALLPKSSIGGSDDDRDAILRKLFRLAVKAGMMDYGALHSLRRTANSRFFFELLDEVGGYQDMVHPETKYVDYNKIPYEWRKNVRTE